MGKYFADWERKEFGTFLTHYVGYCDYYVVQIDSDIVACGGFMKERGVVELIWGMVLRSYHGQSIGKFLTNSRIASIKQKYGAGVLKIDTSQHTKGFYAKCGFVETAFEKDGYEKGLDKVLMEYNISAH